jgi:hypothetical protein
MRSTLGPGAVTPASRLVRHRRCLSAGRRPQRNPAVNPYLADTKRGAAHFTDYPSPRPLRRLATPLRLCRADPYRWMEDPTRRQHATGSKPRTRSPPHPRRPAGREDSASPRSELRRALRFAAAVRRPLFLHAQRRLQNQAVPIADSDRCAALCSIRIRCRPTARSR